MFVDATRCEGAILVKVYLAGPMRGYPEFNVPAFITAAKILRTAGHEVWSPIEHDMRNGIDFTGSDGDLEAFSQATGFNLRTALAADLNWICLEADAMARLPGWEKSLGATAEVATAQALGLHIFNVPD